MRREEARPRRGQEGGQSDDRLRTPGSESPAPHQLDRLPGVGAPACGPPSAGAGAGRGPGPLPGPRRLQSPSLLSRSERRAGAELGRFPGLLPHRFLRLPFCWRYQFSRFPGWLCFNLSPWSRLRRLPLSLGQQEMEGPGSLGQALEPVDFQEQTLGSPSGSAAPPTCLPPNWPGELLKMQFPFIFPVKSLPVP